MANVSFAGSLAHDSEIELGRVMAVLAAAQSVQELFAQSVVRYG